MLAGREHALSGCKYPLPTAAASSARSCSPCLYEVQLLAGRFLSLPIITVHAHQYAKRFL